MTWRSRRFSFSRSRSCFSSRPTVAGPRAGTATTTTAITPLPITSSGSAMRVATPRADPARQQGAGKGPSQTRRSPPAERHQ
jgi:hypothetical protein